MNYHILMQMTVFFKKHDNSVIESLKGSSTLREFSELKPGNSKFEIGWCFCL